MAFMVIDRDHHFSDSHQQSTRTALGECRQRNIEVICSTPSFELWLLCHYIEVTERDESYKANALANRNDFLKREVAKEKAGETTRALLKRTGFALATGARLRESTASATTDVMPPETLQSNVDRIINIMEQHGVPIVDALGKL